MVLTSTTQYAGICEHLYLTGLSRILPSFTPPVEAVSEGVKGTEGGSDGVVVDEADMVTTVVAEDVVELKEGMVTSWASEASSPQWGQKSIPPFALLRPPPNTVTQPRWKRWAMRWSGQHSRNVPWKKTRVWNFKNVKMSGSVAHLSRSALKWIKPHKSLSLYLLNGHVFSCRTQEFCGCRLNTHRALIQTYTYTEVSTAWAAVVFDHVGAMDVTKHHEGHPARRPHGLSFGSQIGADLQLVDGTQITSWTRVSTTLGWFFSCT